MIKILTSGFTNGFTYQIYGLCDDSAIICTDHTISYLGDVFLIDNKHVTPIK